MIRTTKKLVVMVLVAACCGSIWAGTGSGISNVFTIDNRFDFPVYDLEDDSLLGYVVELCGSDADPVNTATGNFYHDETDFSIATRSVPLQFNRHYNSMDTKSGPLGIGWTHSYNITLTSGLGPDTNRVAVRWGDGRTDYWIEDGSGGYDPDMPGLNDTLEQVSSNWKLTRKNLDVSLFDSTGKLQSIIDKNGNAFTLGYDGSSRLVTVTDPALRVVTFAYNPDGTLQRSTDMSGRINQYEYADGRLTRVIDPLGNTTSYEYDASGYLSTITDSRGIVTITNVYDAEGRVVNQTDGKGIVTTFTYGTENEFKKTTITYTDGTSNNHLHSENNLLLMIRYPQGSVSYAYDDEMNRTQIIDRNGNVTNFEYDARNNVTKTTDPNDLDDENDGGVTIFEYNNAGFFDLPTKKIDVLGRVTTWEYDSKGNCTKETDALGNMTVWTYNSFGQKLTETDKNGNTRMYEYAPEGQLTKVIDASGNETTFSYDALWRIVSVTNALGNVTSTVYDNLDRIIQVNGPISTVQYEYDSIGNLIREINPNGNATTYAYDANKNLVTTTDALGNTTTYTYDGLNRRITTTNASGNTTQYAYDDMGRLTTETDPLGNERILTYDAKGNILTETDGSGVTISYEYDSLNRLVKQTDGLGNSQTWEYDKAGHLIKSTDALSNASQYQYDSLGRLTSVTDPKELSTQYQYDSMGRVTLVKDSGGKTINSKTYDALGRVVSKADGNGNISRYEYDAVGNLFTRIDANANRTTYMHDAENRLLKKIYHDASQVVYTYDTNGNLLSATDSTGTTTFVYDAMDRLISSTDSFSKTVQYTYDSIGNRISIVYPADSTKPARTVTYSHDNANRLDTITDWDSRVWDYTLDEAGRMTKLTSPNGMERLHEYDEAGRLSNLQYKNSTDADVITYEYTRDALGNPVNVNETGSLLPDVTALTKNLQMDFDEDNRLTETNGEPYIYDNIGNVTAINKDGQTTSLTYNSENRLTSQTTEASSVQHVYNGLNNRIARIDNGTETRYVLNYGMDMSHILCETDASGNITAYYIHGPEIVGRIDADGGQKYYHTDPVGSVVALTDSTETITDRYAYTPFGSSVGREGSTDNPFTYVGGYGVMTEDDGLYFMRARFYEPHTASFLGKDPLEGTLSQPMSLYRYSYAHNNPVIMIDADGEIVLEAILLGVVAVNYFAPIAMMAMSGDRPGVDYVVSSDYAGVGMGGVAGWVENPDRDIIRDWEERQNPPNSYAEGTISEENLNGYNLGDVITPRNSPTITMETIEPETYGISSYQADTRRALDSKSNNGKNVPAFYDHKLDVFYVNGKAKKIN